MAEENGKKKWNYIDLRTIIFLITIIFFGTIFYADTNSKNEQQDYRLEKIEDSQQVLIALAAKQDTRLSLTEKTLSDYKDFFKEIKDELKSRRNIR